MFDDCTTFEYIANGCSITLLKFFLNLEAFCIYLAFIPLAGYTLKVFLNFVILLHLLSLYSFGGILLKCASNLTFGY